ncbi:MAG: hypothetical protein PHN90_09145 [Methanothrix sp.]|jgi:3,4-dihydroxy-2-butanone 4-phosphate synthase|nr:hypothetical protein [Methanothrix sp.]
MSNRTAERKARIPISFVAPAVVVYKMLDGKTGRALSNEGAVRYARERDLAFVEGGEVLGLYEEMNR